MCSESSAAVIAMILYVIARHITNKPPNKPFLNKFQTWTHAEKKHMDTGHLPNPRSFPRFPSSHRSPHAQTPVRTGTRTGPVRSGANGGLAHRLHHGARQRCGSQRPAGLLRGDDGICRCSKAEAGSCEWRATLVAAPAFWWPGATKTVLVLGVVHVVHDVILGGAWSRRSPSVWLKS